MARPRRPILHDVARAVPPRGDAGPSAAGARLTAMDTIRLTTAPATMPTRLRSLLRSGDTFKHRMVDPVLQQVEHFGDPTITVTDTFKPVSRYWDRITKPPQIVKSLPQALAVMLDPATRGPAFL